QSGLSSLKVIYYSAQLFSSGQPIDSTCRFQYVLNEL
ncbi:hypothetical protein, partial [Shigella boydii]